MKYFIKKRAAIQTLIIEAYGIINTTVAKEMVLATGLRLNSLGFQKCLFDLVNTRVATNQTMTEIFMFVEVFKQAGIDKTVKMAVLYATGAKYHLFLEKCLDFEGYNLIYFKDRDEAINWLCL